MTDKTPAAKKKTTESKAMKLRQDMGNVFGRMRLGETITDYDLVAISLIRSGVKLKEKDIDGYIQHCLTYIHHDIDQKHVGWMSMIGMKHDDERIIEWLNRVFANLKKVVRSYDSKLASAIFKDKHLEEKYHLGSGLKVNSKTFSWIQTCKLARVSPKRFDKEIDKNEEIWKRRIADIHDKSESCKEIGSATHSELDDVMKPINP